MTVSTEVDHNEYTGNGVTTSFPYAFRVFNKSDLIVQVVDIHENITVLTLDTDYIVTGAGGYNGGNVILSKALANGYKISISRELPVTQETDLRNQGKFFAEVHEDAFDKLTMLIQLVKSMARLALRKPSFNATYYDALGNRIRNLDDPLFPQDASTKKYTDSSIKGVINSNISKTLRFPEIVSEMASASSRANSIQGYDSLGRPVPIFSITDTADLCLKLASVNGSSYVGTRFGDTLEQTLNSAQFINSCSLVTSKTLERLSRPSSKIVLVGDSLSAPYNISTVDRSSIFAAHLKRVLQEKFPSSTLFNRAIGGMRYYDLGKDTPAITSYNSQYPWYSDTNRRWIDYIRDINPDVVIISFGMNDGDGWDVGNFPQKTFFKLMAELNDITSMPEIVFCTNILPSSTTSDSEFSSLEAQNGRNAMAGWTRSYAQYVGAGLIDFNRYFNAVRDGIDVVSGNYVRATISKDVTLPYEYEDLSYAYSVSIQFVDIEILSSGIQFQLSSYHNNFINLKYTGSAFETTHYTASTGTVGVFMRNIVKLSAPLGLFSVEFKLIGNFVEITLNDNEILFSSNIVRFGGLFYPRIGGSGNCKIDMQPMIPVKLKKSMTNEDVYSPGSGNNKNHPTAYASSRIYPPVLDGCFNSIFFKEMKTDGVYLDFITGQYEIVNSYSPNLSKKGNVSDILSFVSGDLIYSYSSDILEGAVFGSANKCYIDSNKFLLANQKLRGITVIVEGKQYAGGELAYYVTLGEGLTGNRLHMTITDNNIPRCTAVMNGVSSDLIGSNSFQVNPSIFHKHTSSIDVNNGIHSMAYDNHMASGNIAETEISELTQDIVSKIKLGYASETTSGVDVVIARVQVIFDGLTSSGVCRK
ncbi:TPA: SGNH/GDSL hydrolase family protein [Escherichia coli]|nr:SGNH/GDSL hydrolase family protein [Escherichia coli]